MIVKTELTPYEMWRLETEAESRGLSLSAFLRGAAVALVKGDLMKDPLRELHAIGMCDADIGLQLGLDASAVKRRRARLGLPAHRRFKKQENKS